MLRTDGDAEQRVFDPTTRLLHWLTFGLITLVFVFAFSIALTTSRASHTALLQLHRSFGVTVWAIILVRLVWRQFARFPNWPTDMPQSMRLAAKGSEYALYALANAADPGASADQRPRRSSGPVLPRPATAPDRSGSPARLAAPSGA
jgi:hypothetical protein